MNRSEAGKLVAPIGSDALVKHGVHRHQRHPVDKWPIHMREQFFAHYQALMALDHIEDSDTHIVEQVCRVSVLLAQAYDYLAEHGFTTSSGGVVGILKPLVSLENTLRLGLRELGLTPTTRKVLGIEKRRSFLADLLRVTGVDAEEGKGDYCT